MSAPVGARRRRISRLNCFGLKEKPEGSKCDMSEATSRNVKREISTRRVHAVKERAAA